MTAAKSFVFRLADVEVREREFSLTKAGEVLAIEPKAFRVLLILLRNPGKLIPKQELLDAVWGDAAVTENSLSRAVALLRKVLGDEARMPRFIETVATVGYRWVGRVEACEDSTALSTAHTPAEGEAGEGAKNGSPALAEAGVRAKGAGQRGRRWRWPIFAVALVLVLLAGGFWYLSRPLPPPQITGYTQITHDGRRKDLVGTDGSRLYFTQFSPNAIAQVAVNGGEIAQVPITVPGSVAYLMNISPDGSNALIGSFEEGHTENTMWVAPIIGGEARRFGDGENGAFSLDGAWVIYSTKGGDIFVVRTDGTQQRKLASVGSEASSFRWSPDGKVIRFAKAGQLWEMSPDGSGLHQLLPDWHEPGDQCVYAEDGDPGCGNWTPDGRLYVFLLYNSNFTSIRRGEIWALEEGQRSFHRGTANPVRLTTGPIRWVAAIPSRDGKTIFAQGTTQRGELSRIDTRQALPNRTWAGSPRRLFSSQRMGSPLSMSPIPTKSSGRQTGTEAIA